MTFKKGFLLFLLWVAIFVVAGLTILFIVNHFSVIDKESYAPDIQKLEYKDGTERLIYTYSGDRAGPRADFIKDYTGNDLVIYRRNGRFGYFNIITGEEVILSSKHNFDYVWDFDEESGLAAVLENGKIGFIGNDGAYQISPQYPYIRVNSDETDIEFSDGYCVLPTQNKDTFGLIDTQNRVILPFIHDYIGNLSEGYRIIGINGKYGLLDSLFNVKIEPVHTDMWINPQGVVVLDADQHSQSLLDFDLKTIVSRYVIDDISPMQRYDEDSDGEESYDYDEETEETEENQTGYSTFTIHEKKGAILNSTGKVIVEAIWDDIRFVSDGVFRAELKGKYFLIDGEGKFIQ